MDDEIWETIYSTRRASGQMLGHNAWIVSKLLRYEWGNPDTDGTSWTWEIQYINGIEE